MRWSGAAILASIVLLPAPAGAWSAPSWAITAGPGLLGGGDGLVTAHLRLGPEWMPEQGLGAGLDAGWLCAAQMPQLGFTTVSPTLIYSLGRQGGTAVSLRGGYTFIVGQREPVVHAGVAFDQDLGHGGRLRLEVRDHVFLGWGNPHAFEVTLGWVAP
jgi:hypothetical protein